MVGMQRQVIALRAFLTPMHARLHCSLSNETFSVLPFSNCPSLSSYPDILVHLNQDYFFLEFRHVPADPHCIQTRSVLYSHYTLE